MVTLQRSLLDLDGDRRLAGRPIARTVLAGGAWIDHAPDWLGGADELFLRLSRGLEWSCRSRPMYGRMLPDPRLTAALPGSEFASHPPFGEVVAVLGERYGVTFPSCWLNLYRDGRDSVAWHGDRVARERDDALVAIVSLGERRPFLLRPKGGGPSTRLSLGQGDLLVMGGTCQRTWDHSVPKVAHAGPRMSLTFRPTGQEPPER